jgi:N-acetylneuraminic acid mutarotase
LPDNVTSTSVFTGGEVADIGGGEITERGICWNTEPEPTTEHFKMLSGTGSGHFTLLLTGLQPGITYYLRAYAINSAGVSYGPEMVFRTLAILGNRMTSFPGETIYHSVLFSIEDKIYMGLGAPDEWDWSPSTDMWEWDQGTGRWRELSAFPVDYSLAAGFAVGGKGYVLASVWSETEGKEVSEFWEFDPAINAWNRKSPIPAGASWLKTAKFSIGNKGYVGLNNNQLWEWDQATDTWTRKADYHVAGRNGAATFVIGNTGYLCGGYATGNEQMILTDLWEYHQASDTWTRKADFPGVPRYSAIGFSIAAKGYVGAGQTSNDPDYEMQDFWAWDQASDEWTRLGAVASSDEVFTGGSVGANGFFLSYAWENVLKIELWTFPMIPENKRSGLQQIPAMPD